MYKSKKLGCHPPQIPLKVGLGAPILDAPTLEVKWQILFFHARGSNVLACPVHHFFTSSIAFSTPLLHGTPSWQVFFIALHSAVLLRWTRWWVGGWSREGLPLLPIPGKVLQEGCEWFYTKYFFVM